ncbi:hypothetical protein [Paenibacillus silvisoli]|uniref:hypothetical protein n=1 Tax=Paenibacillus silvisoli TaxID=3110539 RepID=UPI0028040C65|nr:hypothetical protein [Paenibacillus silvisoli]
MRRKRNSRRNKRSHHSIILLTCAGAALIVGIGQATTQTQALFVSESSEAFTIGALPIFPDTVNQIASIAQAAALEAADCLLASKQAWETLTQSKPSADEADLLAKRIAELAAKASNASGSAAARVAELQAYVSQAQLLVSGLNSGSAETEGSSTGPSSSTLRMNDYAQAAHAIAVNASSSASQDAAAISAIAADASAAASKIRLAEEQALLEEEKEQQQKADEDSTKSPELNEQLPAEESPAEELPADEQTSEAPLPQDPPVEEPSAEQPPAEEISVPESDNKVQEAAVEASSPESAPVPVTVESSPE